MKKPILTAIIAMVMMFAVDAKAQLMFGVKGGYNLTQMSLDKEVLKSSNRNGFFFGPTMAFSLPILGLGVDAAALYDQREARLGDDPYTSLKAKMVTIPVNLRLNFATDGALGIFVFAGPQFGFNLNGKEKIVDAAKTWKFKESNFSVNMGGGITLMRHLQISVNYNVACGKTADVSVQSVTDEVFENDAKIGAWQIAAAFYF